jgi:hypothetical protein
LLSEDLALAVDTLLLDAVAADPSVRLVCAGGLLLLQVLLGLRQRGDERRSVPQRGERASARQRDRIVEGPRPAAVTRICAPVSQ